MDRRTSWTAYVASVATIGRLRDHPVINQNALGDEICEYLYGSFSKMGMSSWPRTLGIAGDRLSDIAWIVSFNAI